ncbi:putative transmembrane protein [Phytophthora cinnamomi]|uniref:putative transmembrane protein n=1 Tax=Phytophthora cinnamomi TaxID=4785 RepID=UPI00355A5964|nr:putative transmembrane protein [Phytophthora cinnamomi]
MATLFGQSDFHHEVSLDSKFSPLEFLAKFDLEHGGWFEFQLDVHFSLVTLQESDDRIMLYLLACDESAKAFLSLPSDSSASTNKTSVPSYCAMPNRTLDYYCQSFPLENQSHDKSFYKSTKKIIGVADNGTSEAEYDILTASNSTNLNFYIDACELLGGDEGILRSCLEYPPPASDGNACFYCPKNYPYLSDTERKLWSEECEVSPAANQVVLGTVAVNLCTEDGECLWQSDSYLVGFYGASSVVWGLAALFGMVHLYATPPGSVVALHYKLMRVPLTQFVYSALSFATKSTAGYFASPKFNVLAVVTLVAQAVALAVSAEVALFIAAGWGITQATLDRIDTIRIRCVAIEWAIAFVMLKQLDVDSIGIAVIWGISWFSIVFLIHYYATANLKMLRLRYRIGEQVNIDTSVVMWKGTLFLHYRRLQKGYIFIATVASLAASDNRWHIWEWISVQGHEVLMFFFYAALSYICRSQQFRFSELETLEIAIEEGAEGADTATSQDNSSGEAVSTSSVIPVIKESVRKKVATALVLNPDKSVLLGTAYTFEKPEEANDESRAKETPGASAS